MTKDQAARYAAFVAATKGHASYDVALALNTQTFGIDWRGTSKHLMAEDYAKATYEPLRDVDLLLLKMALNEKRRLKEQARAKREASKPKLPDDPARQWSVDVAQGLVDRCELRLGSGWSYLSSAAQRSLVDSEVLAFVCHQHDATVSRDAVFCLRRDAQIIAGLWSE